MAKDDGVIRGGVKLGIAAGVIVIIGGVLGSAGLLPSVSNPFATEREQRDSPAILQALEDISEYGAATANLETSFEIEDESFLPDFLQGETVTFQAHGSVDGVIDFTALTEDGITIDGDQVTVTLPEPRLANVHVDPDESRVLDVDRGLFDRLVDLFTEDAVNEEALYGLAEDRLTDAAADTELLDRARENAREFMTGLLTGLGFKDVTVRFATPTSEQS